MNNLYSYISASKSNKSTLKIINTTSYDHSFKDDLSMIDSKEIIIEFANGVTLKKTIETDKNEEVNDALCSECWIDYEIISEPYNINIHPKKKIFTNHCQEDFWLKLNKIRSET